MIRTRFAPSPTGELHIGGARTALFAYLFARHEKGEFLLRIEDTDRERIVEGSLERILESLRWLGIIPDNYADIMIQSKRKEIYQKFALGLVEKDAAYICTCSLERLEKLRAEQEKKGLAPRYDRRCRELKVKSENLKLTELLYRGKAVVRLKMPMTGIIEVNDLIRGRVDFDASLQDDPIILKSDGFPTYHLASVVDDHEMKTTHVIRAEEWLSSTPKHLILYKAFGWQPPEFAHLSMILGIDRKKLSKRHGAAAIMEFKKAGYLPEALVNFMALLGWNPKDEREEFSLPQLILAFSLKNVNATPAVFNIAKLNNINERYLRRRDSGKLGAELAEFGLENPKEGEVALIQRGEFGTLKEVVEYLNKLRQPPEYRADLLVFKKSTRERTKSGLNQARLTLAGCDIWSEEELQNALIQVVVGNDLTNGDVFWPVRAALSGEERSPSPVELLIALGKTESLKRIDQANRKLNVGGKKN